MIFPCFLLSSLILRAISLLFARGGVRDLGMSEGDLAIAVTSRDVTGVTTFSSKSPKALALRCAHASGQGEPRGTSGTERQRPRTGVILRSRRFCGPGAAACEPETRTTRAGRIRERGSVPLAREHTLLVPLGPNTV